MSKIRACMQLPRRLGVLRVYGGSGDRPGKRFENVRFSPFGLFPKPFCAARLQVTHLEAERQRRLPMTDPAPRQTPDQIGPNDRRLEDKNLVIAFKSGDQSAYDQIYRRYSARVNGVCRRMLFDPHDVQEASQEVFLRVYQALGRFNGRYEMGAWIARIATNVCLDQLRAKNRRPHDFAPLETVDNAYEGTFEDDTPETILLQRTEGRRVKRLLASMPPMHRAAIILRDFEGFSYEEIGKTLDISDVQVKALLHRARQSFKRSWAAGVASALLPTRLLQKLKLLSSSSVETAAAGVTSPQLAASCSSIAQQCGQFVVDKVFPVATALGVGLAAGVAVSKPPTREATTQVADAKPTILKSAPVTTSKITKKRAHREVKETEAPLVAPAPVTSPSAAATPAPAESPAAEPGEGTDPPAQEGNANPPSGAPTPAGPPPFSPALGFGATRALPARSNYAEVDCAAGAVDQELRAAIAHGDENYPATFSLDADASAVDFELFVYPEGENGADVTYAGEGTKSASTMSGDRLILDFSGSVRNSDAPDADWKDLPEPTRFDLRIELDCSTFTVVAESLLLS